MKKLVVFKKRSAKEGSKASPKPITNGVFDESKVPTPAPKRSIAKFKERREYIAILQYRPGLRKHSDYQKLGFKVDGDFSEAAIKAAEIATMLGKAMAIDLYEVRKRDLCRVLAVYEVSSFRDWEKENTIEANADKRVKEALRSIKDNNVPISYVKDIRVRG